MKVRIRPKLPKPSISPADDLFPTPDALKQAAAKVARKAAPSRQPRSAASKGAPPVEQPSLPGLSRRGRPRLKNPVPATRRAATSRRKRVAAGARRVELMLAPAVAANLDALAEHFDESRAAVVARLVTRTAKRLLK